MTRAGYFGATTKHAVSSEADSFVVLGAPESRHCYIVLSDVTVYLTRDGTDASENIPKRDVEASYCDYVQGFRSRPATPEEVGAFLAKHIPGLRQTRPTVAGARVRHYVFPPLGQMRDGFLKMNPGYELRPKQHSFRGRRHGLGSVENVFC